MATGPDSVAGLAGRLTQAFPGIPRALRKKDERGYGSGTVDIVKEFNERKVAPLLRREFLYRVGCLCKGTGRTAGGVPSGIEIKEDHEITERNVTDHEKR